MLTKIIIVALVAICSLPATLLTPAADSGQSPWSAASVEAKRHRQKKTCKPSAGGRQTVTQTFLTSDPIVIPGAAGATTGAASPYPSTIEVAGFTNGAITDVDLLLLDVTHAVPEDVDVLLSAPGGQRALVMSDVGRIFRVVNIDLTLDDEAAAPLAQTELVSGTYRPTDISSLGDVPDAFDDPAPALDGNIALSAFDGADPNGTWRLWVTDDASGDTGSIAGWALRITAEVDAARADARDASARHEVNVEKKRKRCKR